MERLNGATVHHPGERFTIVDLNPLRIPRMGTVLTADPIVVQLKPRVMPAFVTRVELAHDREEDHNHWQKVYLQVETTPYKRGNTFEMHTNRRVQEGIYVNRAGVYWFVHRSADPEVVREVLGHVGSLSPRLVDMSIQDLVYEQLMVASRAS